MSDYQCLNQVPVSILIPIKNEYKNLGRCLDSVRWAHEVWVVDSYSTDGSEMVLKAESLRRKEENSGKANLVQFDFNGKWPKKKNWALDNLPFANEWIFVLDADEVLPPQASIEIGNIVRNRINLVDGYWVNRRFMFMGKWLKHSYYPNWNLRLFRHKLGRYEKLIDSDTESGDNEVHEHVVVKGKTARLRFEMDHYAFPSVEVFVEKHNRYSNWEARVEVEGRFEDPREKLQEAFVIWRRRVKRWSWRLPCRPTLRFLYVYVVQMGFLDGREGYYFARLHAMYEMLCVIKKRELRLLRARG